MMWTSNLANLTYIRKALGCRNTRLDTQSQGFNFSFRALERLVFCPGTVLNASRIKLSKFFRRLKNSHGMMLLLFKSEAPFIAMLT